MPITVKSCMERFQSLVAPGNDEEFMRLLSEADERLLNAGRWRWVRKPITLEIVDDKILLPSTYRSIVGARIGDVPLSVKWEEFKWMDDSPGSCITMEGGSYLSDEGTIANETGRASLSIGEDVADQLTFTAQVVGESGSVISIEIKEAGPELLVGVSGNAISITPGNASQTDDLIITSDSLQDLINGVWTLVGEAGPKSSYSYPPGDERDYMTWEVDRWKIFRYNSFTIEAVEDVDYPQDVTEWNMTWPEAAVMDLVIVPYANTASTATGIGYAVNNTPEANALVEASVNGDGSWAATSFPQTSLQFSSVLGEEARTYSLTRSSLLETYENSNEPITEIQVLARFASPQLDDEDDALICNSHAAVKQMCMAIVYEESNNTKLYMEYYSLAIKTLDEQELSDRGTAKEIYKPSMTMPLRRRSRTNFP